MNTVFIFAVIAFVVSSTDTYTESYREIPLASSDYALTELVFQIKTQSVSPHILDIFPQSIAAVLFGNEEEEILDSMKATIVRGQWKSFYWGNEPIDIHPTGSSLWMSTNHSDNQRSSLWRKVAYMYSSILGNAFESMCPENGQFKWMSPFDIPTTENKIQRIASNPNDPCCTENLDRLIELLPCRGRSGLGAVLKDMQLAKSEFLQVSVSASRDGLFTAQVAFVTYLGDGEQASQMSIRDRLGRVDECPFVTRDINVKDSWKVMSPYHSSSLPRIRTSRSMMGTPNRPERIQGKLVVHLTNEGSVDALVEYYDQLPFFLVPLWRTYKIFSRYRNDSNHRNLNGLVPSIKNGDGDSTPTYLTWKLRISPGETITISIDVYKKFISNHNFHFGFEKGFDMGSAVVVVSSPSNMTTMAVTYLTRGLTVVIPLPDGSATFNFLAVGCTSIALFFGFTFRAFFPKRSIVIGTDEAALAEKSPPIVKILRFFVNAFKRVFKMIRT